MTPFLPFDSGFEERVRLAFSRQAALELIGAQLVSVQPGEVVIALPFRPDLLQQHGYIHAGLITAIVDTACGYAAYSLMSPDSAVLTVEFKVNFLSPASGDCFTATGRVVKPGKAITVCQGEVVASSGGQEKTVAVMQATMMSLNGRGITG